MFTRNEKGFTLVELMVVVVIIGILASLAMPRFSQMISRAKTTEAKRILGQIIELEIAYYYKFSVFFAFDNVDAPEIDFLLPSNSKFDYKFVDNGDGTGTGTATENVDLNGDADITDGLVLDTNKTTGNLDDGGGDLLFW